MRWRVRQNSISDGWVPKAIAGGTALLGALLLLIAAAANARTTATPPDRLAPQTTPATSNPQALAAPGTPPAGNRTHDLTPADLAAFLDGIVPYAIHRGNIAGATIAVVAGGQVIFAKGYGFADVKSRKPVLPDQTLFRPGSVSKLFTWTAVMQQVQAGKLDLDRDINDYLDFRIPEKFGPITLRDVMTHTPGFEDTFDGSFVDSAARLVPYREYLVEHMPAEIFPPGKVVAYSNYGAMLAGYIVQRISGEPYDEYVERHIFQPLGMDHSTFEQPLPSRLAKDMAKGYVTASDEKPGPFEYVEVAPAGALSSTATDMAHFMIAQLQGGSYDGASILSPATTTLMHTPQSRMAPGMNGFDLGFYQEDRNGLRIIAHAGDTDYFHSDLHLLLDKDVGFFISLNSLGTDGAAEQVRTGLFRAFLDRYYPYSPPVEKTVAHPQADAARVAGSYLSSRRIESALRLINVLTQFSVTSLPNGEIEVGLLKNLAAVPKRWREVGPLVYREVGGQTHLKFVTDSAGHVSYWICDDFIPVMLFQKVHGFRQKGRCHLDGVGPCRGAHPDHRDLGRRLDRTTPVQETAARDPAREAPASRLPGRRAPDALRCRRLGRGFPDVVQQHRWQRHGCHCHRVYLRITGRPRRIGGACGNGAADAERTGRVAGAHRGGTARVMRPVWAVGDLRLRPRQLQLSLLRWPRCGRA